MIPLINLKENLMFEVEWDIRLDNKTEKELELLSKLMKAISELQEEESIKNGNYKKSR